MTTGKIKVLIVDDSLFFREFMSRALSQDPAILVAGLAASAVEAKEKISALRPDVITLDMEILQLNGADFLKGIRQSYPGIQVVAVSSMPGNVFEALQAGAVDFVTKPNAQSKIDNASFIKEATDKIKIAAASSLTKRGGRMAPLSPPPATPPAQPNFPKAPSVILKPQNKKTIIAIGASTGGTEAILAVIKDLPANTPGIVIVQHMPPVFTKMYAERLDRACKMTVREAKDGDRVEQGLVLIAQGDKQMRVRADLTGYFVRCEPGEKVSGHCPSVDVLFESVAQCAGANAIGVILTGMGADGAKSLLAMKKAGAYTIGQDQASCVVYGMPMVAYNLGGVTEQLPLSSISGAIIRRLS